jgi:tetratricopeptide (TPR) repeat protein
LDWIVNMLRYLARGKVSLPTRACTLIAVLLCNMALSAQEELQPVTLPEASAPEEAIEGEDYQTLWARGEYREALDALQKMLEPHEPYLPYRWVEERADLRFEVGEVDDAIADMESLAQSMGEPMYTLRLAELYRYRGRTEDYEASLAKAYWQASGYGGGSRVKNFLAMCRVVEMRGESPQVIFSAIRNQLILQRPDEVLGYVAAGDLAFRKWDYATAAKYYLQGLEMDPKEQQLLAGLSEAFWKSNDPRLDGTLARLLELNPNHPRGRAIEVEILLEAGKTEEALEKTSDALAINPNRLHFLALKAAAHFLDDDTEAMEAVQEQALTFNPTYAEIYRLPGRIASRHYRFKEGADFQQKALQVDPSDNEALMQHGFDLLRIGGEVEGRAALAKAFERDAFITPVFNMLGAMDKLDTFATLADERFVVRLPENEAPIFGDEVLGVLNEVADILVDKYAMDLEVPVDVQIFDNHDDFMVRSVGLPGNAGHLGICFGKLLTMDSPTARAPWSANWKSVLWHEFTHVITLQKTNNRMPRWLSEGISVYEETRQDPSWGMRMSEDYAALVTEDTVGQVAELETYFTRPRSPGHLMFGYFIAGEFVAFYVEEYGFAALTDSLEEIAEGKGTVGALASAANADQQALDDAFGTYLDTRFAPYKNLPEPIAPQDVHTKDPLDVTVIAEPAMARLKADAPFVATMKEAQEAMKEGRWLDAEAALNKAHALFPEYTGQDGPLYGLALVQMNTENIEARKETLEKILQLDSADYPTLDKLMELYLEEENWEKVEALCARAWQLNPIGV